MLRRFLGPILDDARRGDDRVVGHGESVPLPDKPPVMRRTTINLLAAIVLASIIYGTLVPFQFKSFDNFTWRLGWHTPASGDFVANVLIYIPVGVLLRLFFRCRGSTWVSECAFGLLAVGIVSYLTEVGQTIVVARVPSWMDSLSNTGGATIGIVLAPVFQRVFRNLHAWLFRTLRTRPFTAMSAVVTLCIWTYALAPFDLRATPGHVSQRVYTLIHAESLLPFGGGAGGDTFLTSQQRVDKLVAMGTYGLLAFLLVLAAREAGRSLGASAWHALTRSVALVAGIELLQLFTVAHVCDPADMTGGWCCCVLGTLLACRLIGGKSDLHRHPFTVLKRMIMVATVVLILWSGLSAMLSEKVARPPEMNTWLPMVSSFHRTWDGVLGDYTKGLLQYLIVGGLLVIWLRSIGHLPGRIIVIGGTLVSALLGVALATYRQHPIDTAHVLLAILAGHLMIRVDRAVFGMQPTRSTWLRQWCHAPPDTSPLRRLGAS